MSEAVFVERDLQVAARDGIQLATDVYRPQGEGPFPTLVFRVRGSRSAAFITGVLIVNPLEAVRRGYAVVIQEVRGRSGSQSRWHPFVHEREDGEDCLEWVLAQPWCDGRLGSYGTAYSAVTALAMASLARVELKALVLLGTGADYHDGWVYTNGAFELGWNVYWAYMTLSETIMRMDISAEEKLALRREYSEAIKTAPEVAARLPITDHPLLQRCGELQYHEWLEHPDYDEYWESFDVLNDIDRISTPVLSIAGWHDNFLKSHMDLYRGMSERSPEPGRSHHRLLVGPWEHVNYVSPFSTSRTGAVEFGPMAACGAAVSGPLLLDWFDRWVTEKDTGPDGGIRYWQLGADEWRDAPGWPPPHEQVRLYLHSGGGANTRHGDGVLSMDPPSNSEPPDSYVYDPLDPVPTVGGKTLMPTIMGAGIQDQTTVEDRADVLCYTSPTLTQPLEITGPLSVELWVGSSAPDTDFTAKLVDVAPDGFAANLADGIIRARYRESSKQRSAPLAPGEPVLLQIDLWDLACTFKPGHRIRLEISSSNFPRFDRNLNTGHELGADGVADAVVAAQQVLHDIDHPSALVLARATG
ncbi:MAG TPA: CocE/NonD family hydrolase [Solirubrobacteraceae bacterium]|nr:CocE/NonD family hydrolase [Solirubrobacteraceae bacterium]